MLTIDGKRGDTMIVRTTKYIFTAICCLVLSQSAFAADELYDSELTGLAYINIPFGGNEGHSSPTFNFAMAQTPTTNVTYGSENSLNPLLSNPNRKTLFDIQYDLSERQWSRFAFGGINSLVYDNVLHADGGGPAIDPKLVVLGIGAGVGLYFLLDDDDDDDTPAPPPAASDMRLKRDIVELVALESGIKLYSFRYLWEDTVYVGVMAQDLLEHESYKDAVVMQQSGFYAVHYEKLGLKMITLTEWQLDQGNIYANYELAANQ